MPGASTWPQVLSARAPKEHFRAPRGPAHLTGRMGYRLEVGGPRFPSPVCTEKFNHAAWALPGDPAGAGAPLTSALGVDPAHSSRRPRRVLHAFPGALPARPRRHTPSSAAAGPAAPPEAASPALAPASPPGPLLAPPWSTHAPGHAPRVGTHPITSKDTPPGGRPPMQPRPRDTPPKAHRALALKGTNLAS